MTARIAVDAMGGDHAPAMAVEGAVLAAREFGVAYAITKDPVLFYKIAEAHDKSGNCEAAVIYYGQVSNNEDRLAPMNVPILGLFAENDKGVTVETVREFEQTLDALGKNYEIEIYEGAGHAFADPDGSNYNAEIAELAWARVLGFLDYHLSKSAN